MKSVRRTKKVLIPPAAPQSDARAQSPLPLKKSHRLGTVDRLPVKAHGVREWAVQEINNGNMSQTEILSEVNSRLAVLSLPPISRSAFNRYFLYRRRAIETAVGVFASTLNVSYGVLTADTKMQVVLALRAIADELEASVTGRRA